MPQMHYVSSVVLICLLALVMAKQRRIGSLLLTDFRGCNRYQTNAIQWAVVDAISIARGASQRFNRMDVEDLEKDPSILEYLGPYPAHEPFRQGVLSESA